VSEGPTSLQLGISWILRIGVILSVLFNAAGLLLDYAQTGSASLNLAPGSSWNVKAGNFFDFAYSTTRSLSGGLTPVALASLGIVVLMLTPYIRIIAAVFYYSVERDWKYVAITSFVFAVITLGLFIF
jgi:uncharacterized membrane protein